MKKPSIIQAIDEDDSEKLSFTFASGFVASNDSQGLSGIPEPFKIEDNIGKYDFDETLNVFDYTLQSVNSVHTIDFIFPF